jgi:hypothetical protein
MQRLRSIFRSLNDAVTASPMGSGGSPRLSGYPFDSSYRRPRRSA